MNPTKATLTKLWLLHLSLYGAGATVALFGVSPLRFWLSAVPFGLSLATSSMSFVLSGMSPTENAQDTTKERPANIKEREPLYNFADAAPFKVAPRKAKSQPHPDDLIPNRLQITITRAQLHLIADLYFVPKQQRRTLKYATAKGIFKRNNWDGASVDELYDFKWECWDVGVADRGKNNTFILNQNGVDFFGNLCAKNGIEKVKLYRERDVPNLSPAHPLEPDSTAPSVTCKHAQVKHVTFYTKLEPNRYRATQ